MNVERLVPYVERAEENNEKDDGREKTQPVGEQKKSK